MSIIDRFRLDGRTALVTGGAGLYGRQIAEALAQAGARTFMASRDLTRLTAQAELFRQAGLDVTALQFDQSDPASIQALLDQLIESAGQVDVLVNNAVLRPMTDWLDPHEAFEQSMAANATGLFVMTRTFGEHMAERGQGSIINIGSIHGLIAPDQTLYEGLEWSTAPDYFFHKGGLLQLTRYAASKLGPRGVRVNTISPGGMLSKQGEVFVQRYAARTFLGRMANETDLQGAVIFLASDASAYITATNITIDGGYTAK
jgi:NAD(P)-dependent dehydrogenase (short-subunit alcohol dehydrogenase family)